jgi:hypothetical protein
MSIKQRSLVDQKRSAELGIIIDEMGQAMWNASKEYIAGSESPLTLRMKNVLCKFQDYCTRYYGKKTKDA